MGCEVGGIVGKRDGSDEGLIVEGFGVYGSDEGLIVEGRGVGWGDGRGIVAGLREGRDEGRLDGRDVAWSEGEALEIKNKKKTKMKILFISMSAMRELPVQKAR